jgi:hypothetical protein
VISTGSRKKIPDVSAKLNACGFARAVQCDFE